MHRLQHRLPNCTEVTHIRYIQSVLCLHESQLKSSHLQVPGPVSVVSLHFRLVIFFQSSAAEKGGSYSLGGTGAKDIPEIININNSKMP